MVWPSKQGNRESNSNATALRPSSITITLFSCDNQPGIPSAMLYLDLTSSSPAENLACDEALLDFCEERPGLEVLRFWESTERFVVLGYANALHREVNVAACEAAQIPIMRRCSGGGTVLQGPGCLN